METRASDLTAMGRDTGNLVKEKASAWAEKAKATGADAIAKAKTTYAVAQDKAIAGAKYTDTAIRERPYQALGIAFAAGVLLGWLLSSKE